jgi:Na+-transporting methylmalonyl-CoA/oxaloacetate decarboxylase gamma subunit
MSQLISRSIDQEKKKKKKKQDVKDVPPNEKLKLILDFESQL